MKRDASLIPLSRQHFHALALCMRIHRKRGRAEDLQRDMLSLWQDDARYHFRAEERFLFPAARRVNAPLVRELRTEHTKLRGFFALARRRKLKDAELTRFADLLEAHVRKEERRLFEECQKQMSPKDLSQIGAQMEEYFNDSGAVHACKLSRETA